MFEAPFVKSIVLHVFTSAVIHVALYITTKCCSNKAILLRIFHFFTEQMQVLQPFL